VVTSVITFIADFLLTVTVKEFVKNGPTLLKYPPEYTAYFLSHPVIVAAVAIAAVAEIVATIVVAIVVAAIAIVFAGVIQCNCRSRCNIHYMRFM